MAKQIPWNWLKSAFSRFRHNSESGPYSDILELDGTLNIDRFRKLIFDAARSLEKDAPSISRTIDETINALGQKLQIRLYYPKPESFTPQPALVFFHGGGFTLGDLESHDMICRRLAFHSDCVVIATDYRKAPDHVFPAAHQDAEAVWLYFQKNAHKFGIDPVRTALGGDSAGGNLAVFVSQEMIRRKKQQPAFLLLFYPLLQFADLRATPLNLKQSGFSLTPRIFEYFRDNYVPNESDWMDPRISPLFAEDETYRRFPPTHIVTCDWDPLTVEAEVFVNKLHKFAIPVSHIHHPRVAHGFLNLTSFVSKARHALRDSGTALKHALVNSE